MEALISLFAVMAVIGSIIAVWLNTKSGKNGSQIYSVLLIGI